jgi:YEATS domain-containing protein 4
VTETGWGEFGVGIKIQFVPEATEKPLNLTHNIKLHHWGPIIEGSVAAFDSPAPAVPVDTSAATPATEVVEEKKTEAPVGTTPAPTEVKEDGKMEVSEEVVKTETQDSTPVDLTESSQAANQTEIDATLPALSYPIPTRLPVHSWQYDEIVFNDPPAAFLEIMNEHPPTPLPAKFRRPRDQREREEGMKKKKGRASVIRGDSRAQTQEPGAVGTPGPAGPVVGTAGQSGSADVPLEFAKEMETGEFNRLTDARLAIIDQMDKWR